jgi:hypothetical protein
MNPIETVKSWTLGFPVFKQPFPRFRPFGRRNAVTRHIKDIERLTDRLNPLKAARHDAVTGEPNLRSDEQSTFDAGTRSAFQRELDLLQEETEREMQVIDLRIKRLPALPTIEDAPIMATADEREESVLRSWRAPLVDAKRMELAAARSLMAFRRTNPPVQFRAVQSHNLLITVPGILAVAGIEMVLNYELLLRSGGHAPTEIVTLVVLASLFNLLFGLGAGFIGIRNLGHIDLRRNLAGFACALIGALLIVGLATFMANYRNAIDTALNDPQAVTNATLRLQRMAVAKAGVRQIMAHDPLAFLGDLNAVMIFLLGIAFGGVAALEGYCLLDDAYPDYGAAARMNSRAHATRDRAVRQFEEEFASILKTATAQLDAALRRGQQRLAAIKTGLDAAGRTIERYEKAATVVEHALFPNHNQVPGRVSRCPRQPGSVSVGRRYPETKPRTLLRFGQSCGDRRRGNGRLPRPGRADPSTQIKSRPGAGDANRPNEGVSRDYRSGRRTGGGDSVGRSGGHPKPAAARYEACGHEAAETQAVSE